MIEELSKIFKVDKSNIKITNDKIIITKRKSLKENSMFIYHIHIVNDINLCYSEYNRFFKNLIFHKNSLFMKFYSINCYFDIFLDISYIKKMIRKRKIKSLMDMSIFKSYIDTLICNKRH
jgi:hypothetical protein